MEWEGRWEKKGEKRKVLKKQKEEFNINMKIFI